MINEPTLFIVIFLAIMTIAVPQKYFLVPYIIAACFVPRDQRIIIMGLDFTTLRILIVIGVLRILLRGEHRIIRWNTFDKVLLAWATCGAIIYIIQWADTRALIYKSGVLFDIIGLYWLFRQSICSWDDIKFVIKVLAVSVLLLTPLVAFEWTTGQNPFVMLGKVITEMRVGRLRCQASFPHSIMLGLFWAVLVPLFISLAMTEKKKLLYWAAVAASAFIVVASASATPLGVLTIVLVVICAFKFRHFSHHAVLAFFLLLIALHMVMQASVWHLISRIEIVGGSTGWHRYYLIDQAIKHVDEWVLFGTRDTSHWDYKGFSESTQFDITNQYIYEGVQGGLVTLSIFITMLIIAFRTLAKHFKDSSVPEHRWLAWCICCAIVGHCVAFIGVSYFGQIQMLWYMMLSMVGFLAEKMPQKAPVFKSSLGFAYR